MTEKREKEKYFNSMKTVSAILEFIGPYLNKGTD